jgi:hypothetical protein
MRLRLAIAVAVLLAQNSRAGSPIPASTFFGSASGDEILAAAVAPDGSIYVAGIAGGTVPTTPGAFDQTYNGGQDAFVARFSPNLSNLLAATMLGGLGDDGARALYLDSNGTVCIAGYTFSSNFPATGGAFDTAYGGAGDAFVAVLDAGLSNLLAASYLGGTGGDEASAVRKGTGPNLYICGRTASANFPVPGSPFDATPNGSNDAFLARMGGDLATLGVATYLGGSHSDSALSLVIDPADNSVVVAGLSSSTNFPVTPSAFDITLNGPSDLVVSRLPATLSAMIASTYIGPADGGISIGLGLDAAGRIFTACKTSSTNYPTTPGAFDQILGGASDIAVTKLQGDMTNVAASTFAGGSGIDGATGLGVDALGQACVVGWAQSANYPVTPGPVDGIYVGTVANADAIVTKFNASLSALAASTYVRGPGGDDIARCIAFDGSGAAIVGGGTAAPDFPTDPGAYDRTHNGLTDGFVSRLTLRPENTTGLDVEGDGRSDLGLYDPATATWYFNQSTAGNEQFRCGFGSVKPVPGDYDGNGRLDAAVYDGNTGTWYIRQPGGSSLVRRFGYSPTIPVPADYDGDSRTDLAVYAPNSGTWHILGTTAGYSLSQFGYTPVVPVPADYDGDGRADIAVYVRSGGTWYIARSRDGFTAENFGFSTTVPVPADYDGDGLADIAVYDRPHATWYMKQSRNGLKTRVYGVGNVAPVPADYDGDGRADTAVYDLATGTWHILQSKGTNGDRSQHFGYAGALPILIQYTVNRAYGYP